MKTKLYTFRTFPWIDQLPKDTFVFGKLNEDFDKFKKIVLTEKPDLILGLAKASKTRVETKAINRFNKTKKIIKDGPEIYELYVPDFTKSLNLASKPTDSFCNWAMYKLANLIEEEKLDTKIAFIHISKEDLEIIKTQLVD